jgi:APA family basic amino acid/polyamine antiporter
LVCIGVIVLRKQQPDLPRAFKTPIIWFVAPMGALSALYLMTSLPWTTWVRLIVWFLIGMVLYFLYGARHSRLAQTTPLGAPAGGTPHG